MADVRDEYLLCRTISHQWRPSGKLRRARMGGEYVVEFVVACANCPTRREDFISERTGELVYRRYRHPDGYLLHGLDEPMHRSDFRRMFVKRAVKQHDYTAVRGGLDYTPREER